MNTQNTFEINDESAAKAIFMKYSGSDYQIKKLWETVMIHTRNLPVKTVIQKSGHRRYAVIY